MAVQIGNRDKDLMMLVYFHIDELARDAVVAAGLKKELEARGCRLIYGNRFITHHILRHFNVFDAIILSSLDHYINVFPDPQRLPNNVFILQTEAIGQATGTLRRMYGKYFGHDSKQCEPWHRTVAGFLLWGHAHLNPFHEYFPAYLPKCRVVGHPRLSTVCNTPGSGVDRPAGKKPAIGFVSRFTLLSPHDKRMPFESVISSMKFGKGVFPLFENSPDKDVEDMFYTEVIDFRIMLQVMMSLDPDRYDIYVRPHPRENREGWMRLAKKLNIRINVSPWDEPFGHWLQGVDMIVTPPSTSLYDIYFHGKKPIVISEVVQSRANHILTESDDRNQILEGTCRPKSVGEILALIESGDVPYNKELVELRLLEQVGSDVAANSIGNIVTALMEMTSTKGQTEKTLGQRLWRQCFSASSLFLTYLRWVRGRLIGRVEQGGTFDLTLKRMKWINRLAATK
jgi:hypothetical protein